MKKILARTCASTIVLLILIRADAAVSQNSTESCSDFRSFLKKFETDKTYQLAHTKWPLYVANVSLCDERGQPRIDEKSGQPYPKDWCGQDVPQERFKNGVFLIRPLREQSHISQMVEVGNDGATVLLTCDPAHESVCANYWSKYYFVRDTQGCWKLDRWEQRTE